MTVLVISAGCIATNHSADNPTIDEAYLEEISFQHTSYDTIEVDESVDIGITTIDITMQSHINIYSSTTAESLDMIAVLAVPTETVLGQTINPLDILPNDLLFDKISDEITHDGELHIDDAHDTRTTTIDNQNTDITIHNMVFESNSGHTIEGIYITGEVMINDTILNINAITTGYSTDDIESLLQNITLTSDHP